MVLNVFCLSSGWSRKKANPTEHPDLSCAQMTPNQTTKPSNTTAAEKVKDKDRSEFTKLTLLDPTDKDYRKIHEKFKDEKIGVPNSDVKAIFRLNMPQEIIERHAKLKKKMERKWFRINLNLTRQMFHGTKVVCNPNDLIAGGQLCNETKCGLCGIIKEGNKCELSNGAIWSAANSNISFYYCSSERTKVMFLLDVLSNNPPESAVICVFKDEATIPRFLIIFE
ncbi:hypothetical protein G9A89_012591 [Geosiphon pyriformis]|nr:hypothetical protein G9A89_012591 [Geosiphon pyriformis]